MPPHRKRSTVRWIIATLAVLGLVGGAVAVADPDESEHSHHGLAAEPLAQAASGSAEATRACGAATQPTIAAIDAQVARKIYMGELVGREVGEDVAHVTRSQELLSALASGNRAAVYNAVHTIVYTPHWHIVRLRVSANGRVLADVGGPYIIAPIKGSLRQGGAKLGSFVVSVQDDIGYVKLVTRFVGVPIDLYGTPPTPPPHATDKLLLGTLRPAPALPADGAIVKAGGISYLVRVAPADAFPSGKLKVALFVATPAKSLSAQSCAAVRNAAWGSVVKHVAARFHPLASQYQDFVGTLSGSTGGVAFVREGGMQIAGLSAGPRRLPTHGKVSYHGRSWQVFSWSPYPPARIYFLAPS
ncbi:MAG TPA: hypothetical protein VFJ24_11315 [Gaiellales bacterium]|nr:hypothetical protein [Gaiellales bacterium]